MAKARSIVLLKFTAQGIAAVADSTKRAAKFKKLAAKVGVKVESLYWTLGEYDGIATLSGASEEALVSLVLKLAQAGNVRTCMLRTYDADEFGKICRNIPS